MAADLTALNRIAATMDSASVVDTGGGLHAVRLDAANDGEILATPDPDGWIVGHFDADGSLVGDIDRISGGDYHVTHAMLNHSART